MLGLGVLGRKLTFTPQLRERNLTFLRVEVPQLALLEDTDPSGAPHICGSLIRGPHICEDPLEELVLAVLEVRRVDPDLLGLNSDISRILGHLKIHDVPSIHNLL